MYVVDKNVPLPSRSEALRRGKPYVFEEYPFDSMEKNDSFFASIDATDVDTEEQKRLAHRLEGRIRGAFETWKKFHNVKGKLTVRQTTEAKEGKPAKRGVRCWLVELEHQEQQQVQEQLKLVCGILPTV